MSTDAPDLAGLEARLAAVAATVHQRAGRARAVAESYQTLSHELAELRVEHEAADRVAGVLSTLGADRDAAAREQVESLVSAGLAAVFGDPDPTAPTLSFHLVSTEARGVPVTEFIVRTTYLDGEVVDTDVLSARGGGMAAFIGLLLRVVLILLTRATGARAPELLVLDESLAMLSREYLDRAGQFLATLARDTGLQILVVTHQPELAEHADVAYRFALDAGGATVVTREEGS